MEEVVKVENLGKQYKLGVTGTGTLSHDLNRFLAKVRGKDDPYKKVGVANDRATTHDSEYVWALRDVSFNLNQGDVLGVIGRNGAGKSTLLKLLSRITSPSEGRIEYKGRIASLLEVGTGFHPELTGLENIYLNGAILGMNKAEIKAKLDDIIDFSGCGAYIKTPVKRYSSGMIVRLGFSVAAHLEPDILVVDEVLAVGDLEFQNKCLGKMSEVSQAGRTILFVSHNMQAVGKLCTKGLYLKNGQMQDFGELSSVVQNYLTADIAENGRYENNIQNEHAEGQINSIQIEDLNGRVNSRFEVGQKWKIIVEFTLNKSIKHCIVAAGIRGAMDDMVNTTWSSPMDLDKGKYRMEFYNDDLIIESGMYSLTIGLSTYERAIEYKDKVISFYVVENIPETLDSRIVRVKGNGVVLNQFKENIIRL